MGRLSTPGRCQPSGRGTRLVTPRHRSHRASGIAARTFTDVAPWHRVRRRLRRWSERRREPTQDFAAVTRGVFTGKAVAMDRLGALRSTSLPEGATMFVALPWEERDARLRETLPVCERIRLAKSQPATLAAHEAIVALGFEGTVLKRLGSAYRPGRHRTWIKRKARFVARAELRSVHQDREGRWHALCELDGRRVHALASARTRELVREPVDLVYSRVDADGGLREARIRTH